MPYHFEYINVGDACVSFNRIALSLSLSEFISCDLALIFCTKIHRFRLTKRFMCVCLLAPFIIVFSHPILLFFSSNVSFTFECSFSSSSFSLEFYPSMWFDSVCRRLNKFYAIPIHILNVICVKLGIQLIYRSIATTLSPPHTFSLSPF